jgi:hypothetical protein
VPSTELWERMSVSIFDIFPSVSSRPDTSLTANLKLREKWFFALPGVMQIHRIALAMPLLHIGGWMMPCARGQSNYATTEAKFGGKKLDSLLLLFNIKHRSSRQSPRKSMLLISLCASPRNLSSFIPATKNTTSHQVTHTYAVSPKSACARIREDKQKLCTLSNNRKDSILRPGIRLGVVCWVLGVGCWVLDAESTIHSRP